MDRVIEKLRQLSKDIDLHKRYLFDFDHRVDLFNEEEQKKLADTNSIFKKNVELKFILNNKLNTKTTDELHFWIINEWGGIKGFKNTQDNIKKIESFLTEMERQKISRTNFQVISSLSKIVSLYRLKDYAIYDSKVIYSLNWLLLRYGESNIYFPSPAGRNKVIAEYSLDIILRFLALQDEYKGFKFYDYKNAYNEYCKLIRSLSSKIWDEENRKEYPFYLEMLLWVIADAEVFDEIKDTVRITLNGV